MKTLDMQLFESILKFWTNKQNTLITISRNLVEYYCKCCMLIGYATRYLFVDR